MKFVTPEQLPYRELREGVRMKTAWGDNIMVTLTEMAPGAVVPEHYHPHEQVGIVLSGSVQVTLEGTTRVLEPGQMYFAAGNERHRMTAMEEGAMIRDIFSPIREEFSVPEKAEKHYFPR
jgi:quercetin dioxygenase-like cupin family protein